MKLITAITMPAADENVLLSNNVRVTICNLEYSSQNENLRTSQISLCMFTSIAHRTHILLKLDLKHLILFFISQFLV